MQRIFDRGFFLIAVFILTMGSVWSNAGQAVQAAQQASAPSGYSTSTKLPQGFAALVPKGYEISSSQWTRFSTMAGVSFAAGKHFEGRHSVFNGTYHLNLDMNQFPGPAYKMREPIYRAQLERDKESKLQSFAGSQSSPVIRYDPPEVTKYSWGYGITQRTTHHFIGAGKGPDEIDYRCHYVGLIADGTTLKKFELTVSGVDSRTEADQWAKRVADKVEKTTLANIGD